MRHAGQDPADRYLGQEAPEAAQMVVVAMTHHQGIDVRDAALPQKGDQRCPARVEPHAEPGPGVVHEDVAVRLRYGGSCATETPRAQW
jgi:hypothetical protein